MPKTLTDRRAAAASRRAVAPTAETAMDALLTELRAYLDAGTGGPRGA